MEKEKEKARIITGEVRMSDRGDRVYQINIVLPNVGPLNCIHIGGEEAMSRMKDALQCAAKDIERLMSIGRVPEKAVKALKGRK